MYIHYSTQKLLWSKYLWKTKNNYFIAAEEDDIWKLFESCGPIESVRLIRDAATTLCKGFGFVNFKTVDAVELALQMAPVVLNKREIKIKPCKSLSSVARKSSAKVMSNYYIKLINILKKLVIFNIVA